MSRDRSPSALDSSPRSVPERASPSSTTRSVTTARSHGAASARKQTAGKDEQRQLVDEQRRAADLLPRQQQASRRDSREHQAEPGTGLQHDQAGPSGWADRPDILAGADAEQERGQQDGGARIPPDRRDDRRGVADRDGASDQP